MRVALLAYLMHSGTDYRAAGVNTYTRQLLTHLPGAGPHHEYIAFHGKDAHPVAGVRSILSSLPTVRAPVRIMWEQLAFPVQASLADADIVHGTVNVVPLMSRRPSVVTVHDLAFLRHPERFPPAKSLYLRLAVRAAARHCQHVIAVSESTRRDLIELVGLSPNDISVIYPGVTSGFRPLPSGEVDRFRASRFAGRPYVLHVGTLEPRKNIDVLIRAFALTRSTSKLPHVLALVGARGWRYQPLLTLVSELGMEEHVRFIDYVHSADLPLWYNGADLFAYPSAYEGFGLPVLEAMACGLPTVTSASSSLLELVGNACLTVESGSPESLHGAMTHILENPDLRAALGNAGMIRAAGFSWEKTARRTIEIYERFEGSAIS